MILYFTTIILICFISFILNKLYDIIDNNNNLIEEFNNFKKEMYNIQENLIINKVCSSGINSYIVERLNNYHNIVKYFDIKLGIKYDKYYAIDNCNDEEYLYIGLIDYYNKNKNNFLESLFHKYVTNITIYIDIYIIDINYNDKSYTVDNSKYSINVDNYIKKPYQLNNIDKNSNIIQLLLKVIENNNYFFIKKSTGYCELIYTNGIHNIKLYKFNVKYDKYKKYYY